jgi:hypothetical protein
LPFLLAELERAVLLVLDRRRLDLRIASTSRVSVESLWLQRDIEQELRTRSHISVTAHARSVVDAKTKLVDLVLATEEARLLVELKTIITNYGQPGKNITQSRDAIRTDLRALGMRLDENTTGAAVWLAYPIPAERDSDWRINHLRRIERDARATRRIAAINVGQAYVHAYLSEARPEAARVVA